MITATTHFAPRQGENIVKWRSRCLTPTSDSKAMFCRFLDLGMTVIWVWKFCVVGAVLYTLGCLAASLLSTH